MLSSAVLNLSKVLKTFNLEANSTVAYSVNGNTLSVNTVFANHVRGVRKDIILGVSNQPIDFTGTEIIMDAQTININAQTFIVDTTNMMVTDNNINVNRGGTTLSGAGITIMSGVSTESAKLVIDSTNGWLFTSPGNTVDVRELSAGTISTLTLSADLLSAAGFNFTDRIRVQGDLSATSTTFVNLSIASVLRSDRLDATTMFASNVSLGTLVSNTTLSVGTFIVSGLSAPSVSLSQIVADVRVNASLLSVQNLSIVQTNDSTTLGVISNLFASQIQHPAVVFPQPLLGFQNVHQTLVHVFTPTFEINTGGQNFFFLSNLSSNAFVDGTAVQLTSDLVYRFLSGTRPLSAVGSISLYSTSGATILVRYRTGLTSVTAGQYVIEFGENVNNATGTARMYPNGYFNFSPTGGRWGNSGDEPNALTTSPVSNAFQIAAITFSPSATGLAPIVKTYGNDGALRYTTTVSAALTSANAAFKLVPNQTTLPMSVDIAAIAIFKTEIAAADMAAAYRIMGQLQFGGVHMGSGASFISTLSTTALTVATLHTNAVVNWPSTNKTVLAYRTDISTLNVEFGINFGMGPGAGGTTIGTISGQNTTVSIIQTGTTGSILGYTSVVLNFAGNGGSAFQINTPSLYVNSQLLVSYVSARDLVYFNTAPTITNVSVQNHTYTLSLSAAQMSVASFFAPSISVGTTFGTPSVYTSTGFVSVTANVLNTVSTLFMSTLRFNTPTGLGPSIRMDYGRAFCTNGTVTVTLATNMFATPPTVFVTPMVVSGDVTEIHTTSVLSTQFEVRANLSAGGTPAQTRFCWIAVGV
jgi:hypothetical protein